MICGKIFFLFNIEDCPFEGARFHFLVESNIRSGPVMILGNVVRSAVVKVVLLDLVDES
jgi:hypothetical protein